MTEPKTAAGVRYHATHLEITRRRLTLDDWLDICRALGAMASGHQWWIGDSLIAGEERFGEDAAQGEAVLGIAPQTALNYRWVASRFEASRRRENLTWSHHAETARLEPDDQDRWLDQATEGEWTVRELRDRLALERPQPPEPAPKPEPATTEAELAAIARRLEAISASLESWQATAAGDLTKLGDYIDGDDVGWLVNTLRAATLGGPH